VTYKDFYRLLDIAPTATAEEVKRAFRQQIARYHPDKVQHLGAEFQAMAADRAAELTEAYRVLSDKGRRAEYDRTHRAAAPQPDAPPAAPPPPSWDAPKRPEPAAGDAAARQTPPPRPAEERSASTLFSSERATRDEFVRKAAITRLRAALGAADPSYDETTVRGFDVAWLPKSTMFGRRKGPRVVGRFVGQVDRAAVADSMAQAARWSGGSGDDVCVFLMGTGMASAGELAAEIADQRRRQRAARLILIPVDVRVWDARVPLDAPDVAKTVLARLKAG